MITKKKIVGKASKVMDKVDSKFKAKGQKASPMKQTLGAMNVAKSAVKSTVPTKAAGGVKPTTVKAGTTPPVKMKKC